MRQAIPSRLSRTKKCPRCGMRYSKNSSVCTHCDGLDDEQLAMLLKRKKQRASERGKSDKLIFFAIGLAIAVAVMFSLAK